MFTYDDLKLMATPTAMQNISELQNIIQADDGCNIQFTSGTTGISLMKLFNKIYSDCIKF